MELIKLKFVDLKYDFIINSKCILIFNFFRMILIIMGGKRIDMYFDIIILIYY